MKKQNKNNTGIKKKRSKLETILGVISVILLLASLIVIGGGLSTMSDYSKRNMSTPRESEYIWSVERGSYFRAVEHTARDRAAGTVVSEDVAECQAVADYYRAAVLRHAAEVAESAGYSGSGTNNSAAWQQAMDDAYARMGSQQKHAEEIREIVGE
ncbi:MAG: hypothetical protein IKF45_07560 [Lachnospiraceae bacterium]|nr:hypothetical protein [Lachnospiraceae bacterium]